MKSLYLFILFFLLNVGFVCAQHDHDDHHHGRNEIGVSTGALYGFDDDVWGPGIHIHYLRSLGDHSKWALGGFIEQAWLDHSHFTVGVGAKYEIIDKLNLGLFPGVSFAKHHHDDGHGHHSDKTKTEFSVHTEVVYDLFEWNKFHMGPAFDFSWSKNDSHSMLGIHVAYCF